MNGRTSARSLLFTLAILLAAACNLPSVGAVASSPEPPSPPAQTLAQPTASVEAQPVTPTLPANPGPAARYDPGNPILTELYVSPSGSDANSGAEAGSPLRTLTEAWNRVPAVLGTSGYRINLLPGVYPCEPGPETENCLNYFSGRTGTLEHPIIIQAEGGPGTVTLRGGLNLDSVHYLYLIGLDMVGGADLPVNVSGNNLLHIYNSDHVLLSRLNLSGPACNNDTCNNLQEVLKVNQVQYLYVEDSVIGGAWHSSVDYFVVQYGHFVYNKVHTAGQWCMYVKGGSAYLAIEGNEFGDAARPCQLGFQAGQAANFAMMHSPWLHYEVYDIKFTNNVLHDIPGVGMSVSGGYNVLMAYNTLYRVGADASNGYPLIQLIHGERNCTPTDELQTPETVCQGNITSGGWGPNFVTDSAAVIPNRNVFIYNNLFYNPAPAQTLYTHLIVEGPVDLPAGFVNIPDPSNADDNLVVAGNVIWNGPADHPLGIGDPGQGCQPGNPTCNAGQLATQNHINEFEPQLVDPAHGNYRPVEGGNLFTVASVPIPDFSWSDAPASPLVPAGNLSNQVGTDRASFARPASGPPGAYAGEPAGLVYLPFTLAGAPRRGATAIAVPLR